MRPVFFTSFVILVHISIKSYDLIVALTQGGPGISTTMPALYMTQTAFHKSQVGLSAASAMMMFMAVAAVIPSNHLVQLPSFSQIQIQATDGGNDATAVCYWG